MSIEKGPSHGSKNKELPKLNRRAFLKASAAALAAPVLGGNGETEAEETVARKNRDIAESKETEDDNPRRCVIKVPPEKVTRVNLPGGDVLEIYEKQVVEFKLLAFLLKGGLPR